jgi:beta-aspartyl-peptidase (threonine type)
MAFMAPCEAGAPGQLVAPAEADACARVISIVVHGGAWSIPESDLAPSAAGAKQAVAAGYAVLQAGGSALDAVEAAVRVLEDDPVFDAGRGSVLNEAGNVEMDALIIDGSTLKSGAVIGIDNVAHPITIARKVMTDTPHAILAGEGARLFAAKCHEPLIDGRTLVTPEAHSEWQGRKNFSESISNSFVNLQAIVAGPDASSHDTVGCVALDSSGNIAAGTSTGGITMKMVGRVGDSPLVGCGGYVDNEVGGCSTTGHGESIIKVMLAHRAVSALQAAPTDPGTAAEHAIEFMRTRVDGFGGLILLSRDGSVGIAHSTKAMAWAAAVGTSGMQPPACFDSGYTARRGEERIGSISIAACGKHV